MQNWASGQNIIIITGEASGDLHGANLVREMQAINPALSFYGIGGPKLKEAGVELIADAAEIAVVGLTEVASKLGNFFSIIKKLKSYFDKLQPVLVILIDFPDFNLYIVAREAKKRKIKVFYYISPQVWAWRRGRIKQIKKLVDEMAVILPFEVDVYAEEGFQVTYVGHPLLDEVKTRFTNKNEARRHFGLNESKTTIGLLPGSRTAEVNRLLPEMMRAAQLINKKLPDAQYILPLANTLEEEIVTSIISKFGVEVKIVSRGTYDALSCCDFAIVTSGTATLETGLLGVPMVIVYKLSLFSALLGSLIIDAPHIGLVNIIAGKTVVPELIQLDANAKRIANEALALLSSKEKRGKVIAQLETVREKLGIPGAAGRAAQIACNMI